VIGAAMLLQGCQSNPLNWLSRTNADAQEEFVQQASIARLSERHGQGAFAAQVYQGILRKDPTNQLACHRLGVIAARQGRFDEAGRYFSQAQSRGAVSSELLADMGYALYLQQRLEEAETTLRNALTRDPRNKAARNNLGLVLAEQGRYDESLREFQEVVDEAGAYANLAFVYSQMGNLDSAEANYHKALAINNELRPAAEGLVQVAERRRRTNFATAYPATLPMRRPRAAALPEQRHTSVGAAFQPSEKMVRAVQPSGQALDRSAAIAASRPHRDDHVQRVGHHAAARDRNIVWSTKGGSAAQFHAPSAGGIPLRLHGPPPTPLPKSPIAELKPPVLGAGTARRVGDGQPVSRSSY